MLLGCAKGPSTPFAADGAEGETETGTEIDNQEYMITLFSDATGVTMTNAAVAGTEPANNISRTVVSLPLATQVRAHFASSLTSATVRLRIEYSLNSGSNWLPLVPEFAASTSANANSLSPWSNIPTDARTTVLLRALVLGDGVLDPVIRYIRVGYR